MKILIADDHPIYIEGLSNLLCAYGFTVCGFAKDGDEACTLAASLHPDVVLMDANMPGMDGIEATYKITGQFPGIKVVILTGIENDELLLNAIKAGASGFLLKSLDGKTLCDDLHALGEGHNPFSASIEKMLLKRIAGNPDDKKETVCYSERDCRILDMLSRGYTYKEIGKEIALSESAVKYHINLLKEKSGAATQAELLTSYLESKK